MKKLLIFVVTAALAFSFTSCLDECQKNGTADLIITNNSGEDFWFEVTSVNNNPVESRFILNNESSTFTTKAGNIKIWLSTTNNLENLYAINEISLEECRTETYVIEQCDINQTGQVIIANKTGEDLWFDVTGDDGMTTENRMLKSGEYTTYTISAGTAKIWASYTNINDDFQLVETSDLAQCDILNYVTPSQTCALFQYTDITVKNETGYGLYFDVWIYDETHTDDGYYLGEVFIETGEQYTYANIAIGDGWANFEYYVNDTWYMTDDDYEINACTPFTFTWTSEKSIETKVSKRRANGIIGEFEREIKK